jgi:hypothetical protein
MPTAQAAKTAAKDTAPADITVPAHKRLAGRERTALAREVAKRYRKGASIRELSTATGRSFGFVHRLLGEAGVTLRGRGGPVRKAAKK